MLVGRRASLVNVYRERAQLHVKERYDWESVVDQYEDLFARMARQPPPQFIPSAKGLSAQEYVISEGLSEG